VKTGVGTRESGMGRIARFRIAWAVAATLLGASVGRAQAPLWPDAPWRAFVTGNYPQGFIPVSLAAGDLDGDGDIDVLVGQFFFGGPGVSVLKNTGDGTFRDISEASGVAKPEGHYGLSVLTGDFNEDGLIDIYVACDQTPSLLYINKGGDRFEEEGVLRGVAFDQNGKALSGMGVDAADYARDGHAGIFRSNFSDEFETLYRNRGKGIFDDVTLEAGLGVNTRYVGWGVGFFDFDNDGWKDLLLVNGHAFPEVEKLHIDIHYKDHAILYRNLRNAKFQDISQNAGPAFAERHSARGAAFGDFDNDGMIEIAVNNQNEAPSLWKQTASSPANWVTLKLTGTRSNRSAIGARVKLLAGGRAQYGEVRSGGSYLSQSDLRLHFGLGEARIVDSIEILWPGGKRQTLEKQAVNRIVNIREDM